MELRYVPAGEFFMGSSTTDSNRDVNEEPEHKVYLDAFWMSKTQVTNGMFNACVAAGACSYSVMLTTNPNYINPLYAAHPVVYIAWDMAQTYCKLDRRAFTHRGRMGESRARARWPALPLGQPDGAHQVCQCG